MLMGNTGGLDQVWWSRERWQTHHHSWRTALCPLFLLNVDVYLDMCSYRAMQMLRDSQGTHIQSLWKHLSNVGIFAHVTTMFYYRSTWFWSYVGWTIDETVEVNENFSAAHHIFWRKANLCIFLQQHSQKKITSMSHFVLHSSLIESKWKITGREACAAKLLYRSSLTLFNVSLNSGPEWNYGSDSFIFQRLPPAVALCSSLNGSVPHTSLHWSRVQRLQSFLPRRRSREPKRQIFTDL